MKEFANLEIKKSTEKVIKTFQKVILNAQRSGELYHNPLTSNTLPASLPLIGGGYVRMGLENGGTYAPVLYIEILSNNSLGELERHEGKIIYHNIGPQQFEIVSTEDPNGIAFLHSLARFNPHKDIDLEAIPHPTEDQQYILQNFG